MAKSVLVLFDGTGQVLTSPHYYTFKHNHLRPTHSPTLAVSLAGVDGLHFLRTCDTPRRPACSSAACKGSCMPQHLRARSFEG